MVISKWFKRSPRKVEVTYKGGENKLQIVKINTETEYLHESLGIPEDRVTELGDATQEAFRTSGDISEAAEKVSGMCRHPNELFFVVYLLARNQTGPSLIDMLRQQMGNK